MSCVISPIKYLLDDDLRRSFDPVGGVRSTGADPADDEQELFNPRLLK